MNIEYDLMDDILDRLIDIKFSMNNENFFDAAFELGIVTHILQDQMQTYNDDCD